MGLLRRMRLRLADLLGLDAASLQDASHRWLRFVRYVLVVVAVCSAVVLAVALAACALAWLAAVQTAVVRWYFMRGAPSSASLPLSLDASFDWAGHGRGGDAAADAAADAWRALTRAAERTRADAGAAAAIVAALLPAGQPATAAVVNAAARLLKAAVADPNAASPANDDDGAERTATASDTADGRGAGGPPFAPRPPRGGQTTLLAAAYVPLQALTGPSDSYDADASGILAALARGSGGAFVTGLFASTGPFAFSASAEYDFSLRLTLPRTRHNLETVGTLTAAIEVLVDDSNGDGTARSSNGVVVLSRGVASRAMSHAPPSARAARNALFLVPALMSGGDPDAEVLTFPLLQRFHPPVDWQRRIRGMNISVRSSGPVERTFDVYSAVLDVSVELHGLAYYFQTYPVASAAVVFLGCFLWDAAVACGVAAVAVGAAIALIGSRAADRGGGGGGGSSGASATTTPAVRPAPFLQHRPAPLLAAATFAASERPVVAVAVAAVAGQRVATASTDAAGAGVANYTDTDEEAAYNATTPAPGIGCALPQPEATPSLSSGDSAFSEDGFSQSRSPEAAGRVRTAATHIRHRRPPPINADLGGSGVVK